MWPPRAAGAAGEEEEWGRSWWRSSPCSQREEGAGSGAGACLPGNAPGTRPGEAAEPRRRCRRKTRQDPVIARSLGWALPQLSGPQLLGTAPARPPGTAPGRLRGIPASQRRRGRTLPRQGGRLEAASGGELHLCWGKDREKSGGAELQEGSLQCASRAWLPAQLRVGSCSTVAAALGCLMQRGGRAVLEYRLY